MTTYRTAPNTPPGHCPRDGKPLAEHPRCACCGLLIGAQHYAARAYERNGRVLCLDCYRRGR